MPLSPVLPVPTDPVLPPTTLDCVCWPEAVPMGAPYRCAPCVDAAVLIDALAYDEHGDDPAIPGVTKAHVRDAIERAAPARLEGDPCAVLRELVAALVAWGTVDAADELMARRGRYAMQRRRTRTGFRPVPPVNAWTEDLALELLHGPGGCASATAV